MTVLVANTLTTSTHLYWMNRTNELAYSMSTYAVTTNSNTATGNAAITGTFTANTFIGNTFSGIANNTSFVGTVSAANVVSNAQLIANLTSYQTAAGLSANVAGLTSNNSNFLGGLAAANYANTSSPLIITSIKIGNTTANLVINTSSIYITNSTSNINFIIPTTTQVSNGQFYYNANGSWVYFAPAATVAGSNTQIQFNDSGSSNATSGLTFNKTTNTMSTSNSINYGASTLTTVTITTTGLSFVNIDSFSINSFRSAKYIVSVKDNNANNYQLSEILMIHDGGNIYTTEFGIVQTNTSLGSFSGAINSTSASLSFSPSSSNTTINASRFVINV